MNKALNSIQLFVMRDDGAQVIEYALIIAVVTIVLAIALRDLTGTNFSGFVGRVGDCLSGTCV